MTQLLYGALAVTGLAVLIGIVVHIAVNKRLVRGEVFSQAGSFKAKTSSVSNVKLVSVGNTASDVESGKSRVGRLGRTIWNRTLLISEEGLAKPPAWDWLLLSWRQIALRKPLCRLAIHIHCLIEPIYSGSGGYSGNDIQGHGGAEIFQEHLVTQNNLRRSEIVSHYFDWLARPNPSPLHLNQRIMVFPELLLGGSGGSYGSLSLLPHLDKLSSENYQGSYSSERNDNFQTEPNLVSEFLLGAASLFGAIVFAYFYWQANTNLDARLFFPAFLGLVLFGYGFYVLLDIV